MTDTGHTVSLLHRIYRATYPDGTTEEVLAVSCKRDAGDEYAWVLARARGWCCYHTHDSRRSQRGWPDLVLVRPPRLLIRELKREGENPTEEQAWWLEALRQCGMDVGVWRPGDWPEIESSLA